ncbi:MAG: LysR family transcriptional regulator substrate-binding protein [Xanthomonadaceae bacterium]|nr:LysR family transcriptional regulator substrate-binding protein [Xanthomonadaceae bacterium]
MEVMKQYRELLLRFKITDETDQGNWIDDLKTGVAQIAVVHPDLVPRELDSKMLKPNRYALVGPKPWKSRTIQDVVSSERIIDFGPNDHMTFNYLRKFKLSDLARTERYFVNNNESLAEMIEAGVGYGVLTLEFAERFSERCEIVVLNQGKVLDQPMAMAWYPRPSSPDYWSALVKAVK